VHFGLISTRSGGSARGEDSRLDSTTALSQGDHTMKFGILLLLSLIPHSGAADELIMKPVARTDQNSRIAHEQLLEKAKKGRIDVYFVGDSITRRWGASDPQYRSFLENWTTNFFGWNAANFGWGADRIENILWRLENGELDGVNPKIIVVLAGINNIGKDPAPPQKATHIAAGIKAVADVCQAKAPEAAIVLTAIFPRNDNMQVIPVINDVNRQIAKLADGKKVRFVDINRQIADENGKFFEGMVNPDKLHPALPAYQIWADALKPIFTEIIGPRRTTDLAPPPTGDPSALNKK
jgi:lysophospholipase L1-like esterase